MPSDGPRNQSKIPKKRTTWISVPPVYQSSYDAFIADASCWQKIRDNSASHYEEHGTDLDKKTVTRLLTEIPADSNRTCTYFVYHYIRPRGVAVVSMTEEPGYATIRYLLGDGSEAGIGMTLIESVATFSQQKGGDGKLRLVPDNDKLVSYYTSFGFAITNKETSFSGDIMTVDPNLAPTIWHLAGNEWRLYKNDPMATWR